MMKCIKNPILRGFNPDPSIIRVEDDYYIATSTFEWFPGVQIHHSRDLIHWKLVARPLQRVSQLDMKGAMSSSGIWAPCLSYDKGTYYLIYTDVKHHGPGWMDCHNYLVTAKDITGEWSEPVYLNSSGFDPSLFHDDDGRKWLVNMLRDFRKGKNPFAGIVLQEYSTHERKLIGPIINIFKGTELGFTEGPHLYKRNGWYYLLTAEGGTSYNHAVTFARSRTLSGPYELHPENPVLTSRNDPKLVLQKAGHADIVETQNGEWYMVHLCGRPLSEMRRCVLGRETSIQKVEWRDDGWLYLVEGGNQPSEFVKAPGLPEHPWEKEPEKDNFDTGALNLHFQTLRAPMDDSWLTMKERPGYLRLRGRESLRSKFNQSFVARRQQAFCYTASTCLEFEPENFQQMAGLVCWYNTDIFYYLRISRDESIGKCLGIVSCDRGKFEEPLENEVCVEGWNRCYLRADIDFDRLQFSCSSDGLNWNEVGPVLDASRLSDEYAHGLGAFTGAFVGLCCQDLSGQKKHADFDYFEYVEREKTESQNLYLRRK